MFKIKNYSLRSISAELVIAICGWCFGVLYFWPGFMSNDSVYQLEMSRSGFYDNWHPPMMSVMWGILEFALFNGPGPMLLMQMTLYWVTVYLLVCHYVSSSSRSHTLLIIGLWPPFFLHAGVIWKDVQMSLALLFAFCLLVCIKKKSISLPCAAFFLLYAVMVRHNSFFASIPIWFLWVSRVFTARTCYLWLIAILVGLFTFVFANLVLERATGSVDRLPFQQILVHDLVAVSLASHENFLPLYLDPSKKLSSDDFAKIYTPCELVPLFCCDDLIVRLKTTTDIENVNSLKSSWIKAVLSNYKAYFFHRSSVFKELLGVGEGGCLPFYYGIVDNSLGIYLPENSIRDIVHALFWDIRNSVLFSSWPYILILMVLLCFSRSLPSGLSILVLSGSLYFFPYYFIATTCDFRMTLWSAQVAWLVAFLVFDPIKTLLDLIMRLLNYKKS
ncbi:MAG TPA: hypothetical protein PKA63_05825 [Oligoflexia bacterium]|nr:hypothetical protein [Oligoflexia bacterium]HMP48168.1 hypothetical protein [Oligoflexia bacterium]